MNETNQTTETKETATFRPTLLVEMLYAIEKHIDRRVEDKLNAVMQAHATMKQIDENFKEQVESVVDYSIAAHETDQEHLTRDDVASIVEDNVQQEVAVQIRNHDFSNQLHDAINDYDFDDKIDNFDFDPKMDDWKDVNNILDSDQTRELIEEILEEKLGELLSKLTITIKE